MSPSSRERAETLYADQLSRGGPGVEVDLDALCIANPSLSDELREVHSAWQSARGVWQALRGTPAPGRYAGAPPVPAAAGGPAGVHGDGGGTGDATLPGSPPPGTPAGSGWGGESRVGPSMPERVLQRLEDNAANRSRFEVVGEVARGGMGAILKVWDPALRRSLAMKVAIARGEEGELSQPEDQRPLARFLEEAQITGQLDHPGVVPVHELGTDDEGRVYFTMRLVRGRELAQVIDDVHAQADGWSIGRAVRILLTICETMAFAHEKGVIHRDLKPANVMIGRFGEVYVMDWGLARVLDGEETKDIRLRRKRRATTSLRVHTDRTATRDTVEASHLVTMDGDIVGTPAYMPPEQARGQIELLDARADVYSVGAILYHLLCGHMPYVLPGTRPSALDILNRVHAGPPTPLEKRAPGASPELVAICEKAMAREPGERYGTMAEMASELQAWLDGRVVKSYETGAVAELRKWVRRNRATAFASAAALLLAVGGLAAVTFVQLRANAELEDKNVELAAANTEARLARDDAVEARGRAEDEAREARRQRDAADRVSGFLVGLFEAPDPRLARGAVVTAKEILDEGAQTIGALSHDPLVRARLELVMGNAYHALGLYEDALPLLEAAWRTRRRDLGGEDPDALEARKSLARVLRSAGRRDEAEGHYEAALAIEERVLGEDDPARLATMTELALLRLQRGRFAESEELYEGSLARRLALLGREHEDTLRSLHDLGLLYREWGRYEEAEDFLKRAHEGRASLLGDDHPDTLRSLNDLAGVLSRLGRWEEAEPHYLEVLAQRRRVLGDEHYDTLITLNDYALLLKSDGRLDEAQSLGEESLEAHREVLGDEHPNTITGMVNLAALRFQSGDIDGAEDLFGEALRIARRVHEPGHPNVLAALNGLARIAVESGRDGDAQPLYEELFERLLETLGPDHPNTLSTQGWLADVYTRTGRTEEALALILELIDRLPAGDPELANWRTIAERLRAREGPR